MTVRIFAGLLCLSLVSCSLFSRRDGLDVGYYLPLTVQLRPAPSVTAAQLKYQDACGQVQSLPLGQPLMEALTRKGGRVFEKLVTGDTGKAVTPDGYLDVAVGLTQLDLVIPRKANRSYPATVAVGLDFAYTAADGTVLYSKKLQSVGRNDIDVTETSCEVKGLGTVAQEAIGNVTDGMAKNLGTSNLIVASAEARKSGGLRSASAAAPPPSPLRAGGEKTQPSTAPATSVTTESAAAPASEPASLTFRAIMRDQNRNLVLHPGEAITIEVEVKNEGPGTAQGVEVVVDSPPALSEQLPSALAVGDLPPGEMKRVVMDGKIGAVKEATQAELMLTLRAASPGVQLPSGKKFLLAMKPESAALAEGMPIDVDELPKRAGKLKQPKAVGIAVGVERYREAGMARVKYAARDAKMVSAYLQAVGGIPAERVRAVTDTHALKTDLAELFEEWLPKQVDATSVVYVYVAGRGVVEGTTGAVSLIPFDGTASPGGRLYSLRRLQEALTKLPIQRAIVMLELSLEATPGSDAPDKIAPAWDSDGAQKDKIMWMVGNRTVQEAHPYDPGQHGLFTYHLLKGLAGSADLDKDGTILAGELCSYTRGQVSKLAREQFGNEQDPLCIPGPGQGALSRLQPFAKFK